MHTFINLWKVAETPDWVEYAYGIEQESSGLLKMNKSNGNVEMLRHAMNVGSIENHNELINFTRKKLQQVSPENGYPDNLYFA